MKGSLTWAHIGDLHADGADGFGSLALLDAIIVELNGPIGDAVDFVFLPGDNANHGTGVQYEHVLRSLRGLRLPWRMISGDHDFEPGNLDAYLAAVPPANRPGFEVVADHRCIFVDMVSAGLGGPDFRLTMHDRRRLTEELARSKADGMQAAVFMHPYPGDLAAHCDEVVRILADGNVAFVDTGHTHYNELLNDGRVLYGATRSTGEIEEGGAGYSLVTSRYGVVSWHFRLVGEQSPFVRILAPADLWLVTRPFDPCHIPRPGTVLVTAHVSASSVAPVMLGEAS